MTMYLPEGFRNSEYYKTRCASLHDDIAKLEDDNEQLRKQDAHSTVVIKSLRKQVADAQDYIAFIWDELNELTGVTSDDQ